MISNCFYDRELVYSFCHIMNHYSAKEFRSPARSTIPLLSFLKDGSSVFADLLASVGISSNPKIHLEYTVPPRAGKGIASHTDAMVIARECALAIEAKWTEPRYETVGEWLQKGTNPMNRQAVMNGWLVLLQKHAHRPLTLKSTSSAVYQMVHRAASACAAGLNPKLLYLQFTPLPNGTPADCRHLRKDLHNLHNLLGSPEDFPFYLVELEVKPTAAYEVIASLSKGAAETGEKVVAALNGEQLFKFNLKKTDRIHS